MKKFITNNWKRILIFIGAVFIIINVFSKLAVEKTLLEDYIKFGKNIEKEGSIIGSATEVVSNNSLATESPFGSEMMQLILVLIAAILLVVFLTSLGDRAAAKAKKK